jgi:hypothetical protein
MRPTLKALLFPIIVPATLLGALLVSLQYCDPEDRRITGALAAATYLSAAIVAGWGVVGVSRAASQLLRDPSLRSWQNITAIGVASAYVIATATYIARTTQFG